MVDALRVLVRAVVREELAKGGSRIDHEDSFLTVRDCSALARVQPRTIREWIKEGRLPASRVGRQLRVRRSDLLVFLGEPRRRRDRVQTESPETRARRDAASVLGRSAMGH